MLVEAFTGRPLVLSARPRFVHSLGPSHFTQLHSSSGSVNLVVLLDLHRVFKSFPLSENTTLLQRQKHVAQTLHTCSGDNPRPDRIVVDLDAFRNNNHHKPPLSFRMMFLSEQSRSNHNVPVVCTRHFYRDLASYSDYIPFEGKTEKLRNH